VSIFDSHRLQPHEILIKAIQNDRLQQALGHRRCESYSSQKSRDVPNTSNHLYQVQLDTGESLPLSLLISSPRTAQIGGSLAALFTSITLLRLKPGHHVTILERSPTPLLHDQGAGIVAGGETQAFFSRHDVSKRGIGVVSKARFYLDREGVVIDEEGYEQRMTSWDLLYFLARANFDGVRSGYLGEGEWGRMAGREEVKEGWRRGKYEFGREVTGIKEEGGKVKIEWKNTKQGGSTEGEPEIGERNADFVVCADGPSSHMRALLLDSPSPRTYAGYVAFRGTAPETSLTPDTAKVFVERFTFYHADGVQILAYTIPGRNGALQPGERLVNWVWYWNCEEEGPEYKEIMTDSEGNFHRFTLPTGGKMQTQVWDRQKQRARDILPPQFAEIVEKTGKPFVQAITDLEPPEHGTKIGRLLNGKTALVGDALAGFRPHTAASTSQAAFDALLLEKVFKGEIGWEEYERRVLEFAWGWQRRGVMLGERSQFGRHPLASGGNAGEVNRRELHLRESARGDGKA
jgi:2-polyprenyl-6-methoxyphenol hydroxylase-like FAD-dependent oxidoreductase